MEPLDDSDRADDHFAVIYETPEERFGAVTPFIQGLERCIYAVDDPAEEREVIDSLRVRGVDVDDTCESGALRFYTSRRRTCGRSRSIRTRCSPSTPT